MCYYLNVHFHGQRVKTVGTDLDMDSRRRQSKIRRRRKSVLLKESAPPSTQQNEFSLRLCDHTDKLHLMYIGRKN